MKSANEIRSEKNSGVSAEDLKMIFPDPGGPLLEGAGAPCTWAECMHETADQTRYWLKHFDNAPPSLTWEEPFEMD